MYFYFCNPQALEDNKSTDLSKKLKKKHDELDTQLYNINKLNSKLASKSEAVDCLEKKNSKMDSLSKTLTNQLEEKEEKLAEMDGKITDIENAKQREIASLSSQLIAMKHKYEQVKIIEVRLNGEIAEIRDEKLRLEEALVS